MQEGADILRALEVGCCSARRGFQGVVARLALHACICFCNAGWHAAATKIACWLQGVYCACYGPHGMEVLLLRMAGPGDSPPRRCTTSGVRLQGMKVVGDPNVPALE